MSRQGRTFTAFRAIIAQTAPPAHDRRSCNNPGTAMSIDLRPTEVWHIKTPDGRHVRAIVFPRGFEVTLAWFVNDRPEGCEDFADLDEAMRRAGELRAMFEA
jgi:hypothetical protein